MKQRLLFVFCLIFGIGGFVAAQGKLVTNADLERYKQDRLKAEREYRENYARLGLPSPEELDRRREQSRLETEQLSAKLRAERLERERLEAEQQANAQLAAAYYRTLQAGQEQYNEPSYFLSYGRRHRIPPRQSFQAGYFAGGQFWPTPTRTPMPRPVWIRPHH